MLAALAAAGCGGGGKSTGSSASTGATPANFDFGSNDPRRATAFGDSITLGVLGDPDLAPRALLKITSRLTTSNNYPNNLQNMLRGLDPTWRVINRGVAGEITQVGLGRFGSVLAADRPGFILIMEGTNDASRELDPSTIVGNLGSMVSLAQGNRTIPVLATIPPNFRNDSGAQGVISQANTLIRAMARSRGIVLAEIFDGMNDRSLFGSPDLGINDPLHPNEQGYVKMAGIWFTAMQRAIPAGPVATAPAPTPTPVPGGTAPAQTKRR